MAFRGATHQMERRRSPRRVPGAAEPICRIRLRTGWELTIVDISHAGALIEGGARLLPGTHVDVHVITRDGRVLVRSRVVRASVCHLQSDVVLYRAALAFERNVDTAVSGYVVPDETPSGGSAEGSDYPDARAEAIATGDEDVAA